VPVWIAWLRRLAQHAGMNRKPKVAIVGGGVGGLAAALALHRRGIEVTVHEQSAAAGDIGAGLNLGPNALKAFRALGVEQAALDAGVLTDRQIIRSWRSGRIILRQNRGAEMTQRFGAPFLTIHRADLIAAFLQALPDGVVQFGDGCVRAEQRGDVAAAHFADGGAVEADIVVGADGIHSAVRESLFGADAPRFTGCICWRGLVPVEAVTTDYGRDMTAWWGPHGHVVHYLVRRGELVNFVAHYDSDAWLDESWTQECGAAEVMDTYARWHASLRELFRSSETYYKWALYDRDPLPAWSKGGITLLGDAAHPMLPYIAQGAGMAVEDACVLAAAIAAVPNDPAAALGAYERNRLPRTTRAQMGARARAKENHLPGNFARLKRDFRLMLRDRFGGGKAAPLYGAWLYDYDAGEAPGLAEALTSV
jgi:salicylate hydroxylase